MPIRAVELKNDSNLDPAEVALSFSGGEEIRFGDLLSAVSDPAGNMPFSSEGAAGILGSSSLVFIVCHCRRKATSWSWPQTCVTPTSAQDHQSSSDGPGAFPEHLAPSRAAVVGGPGPMARPCRAFGLATETSAKAADDVGGSRCSRSQPTRPNR